MAESAAGDGGTDKPTGAGDLRKVSILQHLNNVFKLNGNKITLDETKKQLVGQGITTPEIEGVVAELVGSRILKYDRDPKTEQTILVRGDSPTVTIPSWASPYLVG